MIDHYTQYVGSSPYGSPAVLCGIAHMQTDEGVWYPIGGTRAVPLALEARRELWRRIPHQHQDRKDSRAMAKWACAPIRAKRFRSKRWCPTPIRFAHRELINGAIGAKFESGVATRRLARAWCCISV